MYVRTATEELLKDVSVVLLPAEKNQEMFASVPHQKIEDLAHVFQEGSRAVTNQNLMYLGISAKQFQADALEASARNNLAQMITMEEAFGIPADVLPEKAPGEPQLYVVSNDDMQLGVGVIAYPGFLDHAAERQTAISSSSHLPFTKCW